MKFYKEWAVLTFILLRALDKVQGRNIKPSSRNEQKKYVHALLPGNIPHDALVLQNSAEKTPTSEMSTERMNINTTDLRPRTAKTFDAKNQEYNFKLNLLHPAQKIYCHQINKIAVNSVGEIIERVHHNCGPAPAEKEHSTNALISTTTAKSLVKLGTTSTGINCRRVMNSELNDLGDIVDSVTEVCDPPSTTTTTTRKPIINTTPQVITTTPKSLVKICTPVMDSYLDEEGRIIDSVTTVCKLEEIAVGKLK